MSITDKSALVSENPDIGGRTASMESEQVVVFQLAGEEYAAPILDVQEIIPAGDITPFPNVPDYIAGIINVRGTVATVINLAKRFHLTRMENNDKVDRYIILTSNGKSLFGIMVDDVTSVMKLSRENIKDASGVENKNVDAAYVQGVSVQDNRVILILNFKQIVDEETASTISDSINQSTK